MFLQRCLFESESRALGQLKFGTHRKSFEENEALYYALHGVTSEAEGASQVPALLVADGGRGSQAGVHQGSSRPSVPRGSQHARQRSAFHEPRQRVHARELTHHGTARTAPLIHQIKNSLRIVNVTNFTGFRKIYKTILIFHFSRIT